jgi:hypothetical protein
MVGIAPHAPHVRFATKRDALVPIGPDRVSPHGSGMNFRQNYPVKMNCDGLSHEATALMAAPVELVQTIPAGAQFGI